MPRRRRLAVDELDRAIINSLQSGFPVCERPFQQVAARLGCGEYELIRRIDALLQTGILTRFGPMYHAERMGGALSLVAMAVPAADFDRVAEIVNAFPEVAHNYAREHVLNMWFVLATESAEALQQARAEIEQQTGYAVYNMPKIAEYFVGLRLDA
jgi:DNA-binding Lrp family transcriptional regulator